MNATPPTTADARAVDVRQRESGHDASLEAERIAYGHRVDAFLASREAGWTLTRDALREGMSVEAVIAVAVDSTRFADEALEIVAGEYQPRVDCQEGCSYCCQKPGVLVSIPEVFRILAQIRSTFPPEQIMELKVRAAAYAAQMHGRHFNDLVSDAVPCPLLVGHRCSVYEVRPLVCRGFNSTSVDACRAAHENRDLLIPTFAIFKDVTDGTTVGVAQHLRQAGLNDSLVDLGTAIGIALEAGPGFEEAVVGGARALEAAEDSSWVDDMWVRLCEVARQLGVKV